MFAGKKFWLTASIYLNSVAFGVICLWMLSSPAKQPSESEAAGQDAVDADFQEALAASPGERPFEYTIANGDRFFQIADFDRALTHFRESVSTSPSDALAYRIGLTLEATNRFSDAEAIYLKLSEDSKRPYFRRVSKLGLARIQQKTGRETNGRNSLWRLFLDQSVLLDYPANAQTSDPGMVGTTAHLLSIAYASQLIRPGSEVSLDLNIPVHVELPFDPQYYHAQLLRDLGESDPFDLVKSAASETKPLLPSMLAEIDARQPTHGILLVEQTSEGIDTLGHLVRVRSNQGGLVELFTALEHELDLKIVFSESAIAAIRSRSQTIAVDDLDVATLLHALLAQFELFWMEVDGEIRVVADSDLRPEQLELLNYERAAHILRFSIFDFPGNYFLPATQFVFGNLAFQNREWTTAIANYKEALKTRVLTSHVRQRAAFNMGKALLQIRQFGPAEKSLLYSADESFGGDLAATGLILVSQLHLRQLKYETAVKHASHATVAASSTYLKERATVLLSLAYLLDGKLIAGNQALMDRRGYVSGDAMVRIATFLSAYSRYFAQRTHNNEEPEDLLRGINALQLPVADMPSLSLLVSRAQRALSFQKESIETLVTPYTLLDPCPLRDEFRNEISRALLAAGPYSELTLLYENILETDPDVTETPTQLLRNARIELDNQNYENCKRLCERILKMKVLPEFENQALKLMGQAYERTGDHHTAAIFFAGIYETKGEKNDGT